LRDSTHYSPPTAEAALPDTYGLGLIANTLGVKSKPLTNNASTLLDNQGESNTSAERWFFHDITHT
jgi:hypothetical protein